MQSQLLLGVGRRAAIVTAFVLVVFKTSTGKESIVPLAGDKGGLTASGLHTLFLEDLKVQPGDFVTYHARARDVAHGRRSVEARILGVARLIWKYTTRISIQPAMPPMRMNACRAFHTSKPSPTMITLLFVPMFAAAGYSAVYLLGGGGLLGSFLLINSLFCINCSSAGSSARALSTYSIAFAWSFFTL